MGLNIKNDHVHELAREAARRTGRTQTGAIELALERLLAQTPPSGEDAGFRIDLVLSRIDATITDEMRAALSTDELYDENGLPPLIVDTSAIIAILRREPERADFVAALVEAPGASMSAASYVECAAVVDRLGSATLSRQLDGLLAELGIDIVDVTLEQAQVARAAYKDFGRGSGHPAGLNFGDCFAYALASVTGESLLFKGGDFGHTDLRPALEA